MSSLSYLPAELVHMITEYLSNPVYRVINQTSHIFGAVQGRFDIKRRRYGDLTFLVLVWDNDIDGVACLLKKHRDPQNWICVPGQIYLMHHPKYWRNNTWIGQCERDVALEIASHKGYLDMVKLLREGYDTITGSVICCAVNAGHVSIVEYLWEHADHKYLDCSSPIRFGYLRVLRFLYEHGEPLPDNAFDMACLHRRLECAKYLYKIGKRPSTLILDRSNITTCSIDMLSFLSSIGMKIDFS